MEQQDLAQSIIAILGTVVAVASVLANFVPKAGALGRVLNWIALNFRQPTGSAIVTPAPVAVVTREGELYVGRSTAAGVPVEATHETLIGALARLSDQIRASAETR